MKNANQGCRNPHVESINTVNHEIRAGNGSGAAKEGLCAFNRAGFRSGDRKKPAHVVNSGEVRAPRKDVPSIRRRVGSGEPETADRQTPGTGCIDDKHKQYGRT